MFAVIEATGPMPRNESSGSGRRSMMTSSFWSGILEQVPLVLGGVLLLLDVRRDRGDRAHAAERVQRIGQALDDDFIVLERDLRTGSAGTGWRTAAARCSP